MHVFTPFHLMGFDQRVPPIFEHSTTAWISSVGPCEDGRWLYSVDSVTGVGFSPSDGTYYIDLMVAISSSSPAPGACVAIGPGGEMCFAFARIQATSWVLCYEPPAASHPQGHAHRFNAASLRRDLLAAATRTQITPPAQSAQTGATDGIAQLVAQRLGMSFSLLGGDASSNPDLKRGALVPTSGCVCSTGKKRGTTFPAPPAREGNASSGRSTDS
jgi:hypothetical protein